MKTTNSFKQVFLPIALLLIFTISFFVLNNKDTQKQPKLLPGEWMSSQRMYPYSEIKMEVYQAEMKKAHKMVQQSQSRGYEWELVGPTNIGGRITDLEMPADQSDVIYVGAASGGIFKTEDAGSSWEQIFFDVPTISIGDLVIDPQNPDVIYAGTGEANSSSYSFLGSGVYKSVDAGASWHFSGLENSAYIGRMIVDHANSERIYAAACGNLFTPSDDRGIYRSNDGGDNWEQVLFVTDTTAAIDLVQHPIDADVLYAAFWERSRGLEYRHSHGKTTGIYKTIDGGDTWEELTVGLPDAMDDKGRVGLTISISNPEVLYAFYDMPSQDVYVYKTDNSGDSWQRIDNNNLHGMGSSFAWYFGQVRVHPQDENKVYVLGQYSYRTNNAGSNWSDINNSGLHVDHHAMCFDLNSGKTYMGNDGGLYYTLNDGSSWTKINNLPITQFYAYDVSETDQDFQVGGTQDNNSIHTITGSADDWESHLGGDGMYNRINQQDNSIAYAEYQWGALHVSTNANSNYPYYDYVAYNMSGDRNNWSAPLELTPGQNEIAYFGTHRVWRSTNNGSSWTAISGDLTQGGENYFHSLTCLAISPLNANYILSGAADGKINITTDNGMNWQDISEGLPYRWITDVVFDPQDENTIYTTVSGFRWDEALPHVYKSIDLGANWTSISGNLPELPVNQLVVDPQDSDELIVGTDAGIFMTVDGGENWENINGNLPMVPIVELKLIPATKDLYAATYGVSTHKINLNDVNVGFSESLKPNKDFDINWMKSTAGDFVVLNNDKTQNFSMRIYNASGQLLQQKDFNKLLKGKHQITIDKNTLKASSFVIIEFVGEGTSESLKVIL
ncbi:MAG: hypothetical protein KAH25_08905 [Bacteroidales bacterium]|nr:hypothetical protein [Bacteroidales bacterium]